jgi:hypothetical protein
MRPMVRGGSIAAVAVLAAIWLSGPGAATGPRTLRYREMTALRGGQQYFADTCCGEASQCQLPNNNGPECDSYNTATSCDGSTYYSTPAGANTVA